jgi:hypothetical protein
MVIIGSIPAKLGCLKAVNLGLRRFLQKGNPYGLINPFD